MSTSFVDFQRQVREAIKGTPGDACCVATGLKIKRFTVKDVTLQVDGPGSNNGVRFRIAVAYWNNGSNVVELMPDSQDFSFGQGWPIQPNSGLVLRLDENTSMYFVCASTKTTDLAVMQVVKVEA